MGPGWDDFHIPVQLCVASVDMGCILPWSLALKSAETYNSRSKSNQIKFIYTPHFSKRFIGVYSVKTQFMLK